MRASRIPWFAGLAAALVAVGVAGAVRSEPKAGGLLAFSRAGNIYVQDFGAGEERQLTYDGVPEGEEGVSYGCPTFADEETLLFLSSMNDADGVAGTRQLHALDPAGASEFVTIDELEGPLGLGFSPSARTIYYLLQTGEGGMDGDPFGADITLFSQTQEEAPVQTPVTTWYGGVSLNQCRVRVNPVGDASEVSVPGFPTDVSDFYDLYDIATGDSIPILSEDDLGACIVTGIDFGESGTEYATIAGISEPPPLTSGLYQLDTIAGEHTLIARIRQPWSCAVSEAQQLAAASTVEGQLRLITLENGRSRAIGEGEDPDFFP